ncbi:MAG: tryptophan-rich sensory protein [Spirochaetes bacterium]|nr:tryptophan-rich sensory protein [Spirochaetota bacterium]
MVTVNALANILPINGVTTGAVSDSYGNLFAPAGITFAIWGVIYLLLLMFSVYQCRGFGGGDNAFIEKAGWYFALSCVANAAWIIAWHYDFLLVSLILMIAILTSLITIYVRLDIGRTAVSRMERWFVQIPFSVYLGWITVAAIANATALFVSLSWDGFGISPVVWTVIVIAAAVIITAAVLVTRRDIAYALVVIWALSGIIIKRMTVAPVFTTIVIVCGVGILLILAAGVFSLFKKPAAA